MTSTTFRDHAALRASMRGPVLAPDDEGYDLARAVWNGDIDRRPAVIARCTGPADVAAALAYAQETGLRVAVRGGGHGYWGAAVPEGTRRRQLRRRARVRVPPAPGGSAHAPEPDVRRA